MQLFEQKNMNINLLICVMKNNNCSSGTILKQTWNTTMFVV